MADNLDLPAVSAAQDQKEVTINDAFDQLSGALDDFLEIATGNATYNLTLANFQSYMGFQVSGNTGAQAFNLPSGTTKRTIFMVMNISAGALSVVLGTTTFVLAGGTTTAPTVGLFQTDGTADGLFPVTPAVGSSPSGELDMGVNFSGRPLTSQLFNMAVNRKAKLVISLAGSQMFCGTNPTSTMTFTLYKVVSGTPTSIGTIAISSAGAFTITFTTAITFNPGDVFRVGAPSSRDATGADIAFNFNFTLV